MKELGAQPGPAIPARPGLHRPRRLGLVRRRGAAHTLAHQRPTSTSSRRRDFLFLYTDNFWRDYERFKATGIEFVRPPKTEAPPVCREILSDGRRAAGFVTGPAACVGRFR